MNEHRLSSSSPPSGKGIWSLFKKGLYWIKEIWHRFQFGLANYLRSRTKNFPSVPPKSRRRVVDQIMKDPVFRSSVDQFSRETGFAAEDVEEKARRYVKEIASDLNYLTIPFWDVMLSWVFNKLYEGIDIDLDTLEKIRPLVGKKTIVLVPNHRSHIDYLLFSYVLYNQRFPMPYICAGQNMNFWPVGSWFRKAGAFFIRRSFEGNKLYQAALYAYLHYLLKEKAIMEFFIEGTRSRTGKLLPAKLGILSLLIRACEEQSDIDDIIFVPTSIAYENVLEEGNYSDELEGADKKKEGLRDLFRLRKYLRHRYGKVYVRFDKPLSLTDFMDSIQPQENALLNKMANEIGYAINRNAVITAPSLTAMALLSQEKPVVTEEKLQRSFENFIKYLHYKKAPLSDVVERNKEESLQRALEQYVRSRVLRRYRDEQGTFYVTRRRHRKVLDYYKNTGAHFFISAAAVAKVLLHSDDGRTDQKKLEEEVTFLRDLVDQEFVFARRKALTDHINPVIDYFSSQEWIQEDGSVFTVKDDDALKEMGRILDSTLYVYWGCLSALPNLSAKKWDETELLAALVQRVQLHLIRHHVLNVEALSPFSVRNVLKKFCDSEILRVEKIAQGKKIKRHYQLPQTFDNARHLVDRLTPYLTKA
jgi:glycerol-3-phosphate O-acyltransferase